MAIGRFSCKYCGPRIVGHKKGCPELAEATESRAPSGQAELPGYATGMSVRLLKSGSLCEFVEYMHGNQVLIRRIDTGKEMVATLNGIEVE